MCMIKLFIYIVEPSCGQVDDPENFSETLVINYATGKSSASGATRLHYIELLCDLATSAGSNCMRSSTKYLR